MRKTLVELFEKAIVFEYILPNGSINKSSITNDNDYVFSNPAASDFSLLIYNSILDLAFEDYKIDLTKLNDLQIEALEYFIKYDSTNPDNEKYGFLGETILNVLLQCFFNTDVLVARGNFYSPLDNSEPHGFDSHHFIVRNNKIELWCGEAKFYRSYSEAVKKIIQNINRNLSRQYLSNNFIHIVKNKYPLATLNATAKAFIELIQDQPPKSISELIEKYKPKVVYPALVICDELSTHFTIQKMVERIDKELEDNPILNEINATIFFIFIPVNDSSIIKKEVLNWIKIKKTLI
ncbi:MAG: SAVED domain-containing protein [Candidatus ainarchaeum sp.]|nr:SAVED domain-containing protein [Candidatus ainarchaeum sp.]